MRTYYDILKVSTQATPAQLKKAYRQQSKKYHPDLHGGSKQYEEKFKEIQKAYEILSDTHKRALYDSQLIAEQVQTTQKEKSKIDKDPRTYRRPPVPYKPRPKTKNEKIRDKIIDIALIIAFSLPIWLGFFIFFYGNLEKHEPPSFNPNNKKVVPCLERQSTCNWNIQNIQNPQNLWENNQNLWSYILRSLKNYREATITLQFYFKQLNLSNNYEKAEEIMASLQTYLSINGIPSERIRLQLIHSDIPIPSEQIDSLLTIIVEK